MTKIYTKIGDHGFTSLGHGVKVEKSNDIIHAVGNLDELNSYLGLILALEEQRDRPCVEPVIFTEWLLTVQSDLFFLGGELSMSAQADKINAIDFSGRVVAMESTIDQLTQLLPPLRNFILPGGSLIASHIHIARTIARRAERFLSVVIRATPGNESGFIFINRLSDALFQWARWLNEVENIEVRIWKKN